MKEIIESIKETLETHLPDINIVEVDQGQLSDNKPEADYPCVLIGIDHVTYSQQGNGYQIAQPEVTITVAAHRTGRFGIMIDPLELLDLTDKIHEVLQLHTNGAFAPLYRTLMARLEDAHPNIYGYKVFYQSTRTIPLKPSYGKTLIEDIVLNFR